MKFPDLLLEQCNNTSGADADHLKIAVGTHDIGVWFRSNRLNQELLFSSVSPSAFTCHDAAGKLFNESEAPTEIDDRCGKDHAISDVEGRRGGLSVIANTLDRLIAVCKVSDHGDQRADTADDGVFHAAFVVAA